MKMNPRQIRVYAIEREAQRIAARYILPLGIVIAVIIASAVAS